MRKNSYPAGFSGLGIAPGLMSAIGRLKFEEPTPIQRRAIPVGLEGKDLIAVAQTGTGDPNDSTVGAIEGAWVDTAADARIGASGK